MKPMSESDMLDEGPGSTEEPVSTADRPRTEQPGKTVTKSTAPSSDELQTEARRTTPVHPVAPTHFGHFGGVPGCLVNGTKYAGGKEVPTSSQCRICVCRASVVYCETRKCPPAPKGYCLPFYEKSSCCPTYDCGEGTSFAGNSLNTRCV